MRTLAVMIAGLVLSGCGTIAKMDDLNQFDSSLAAYRNCVAAHKDELNACEPQRAQYLAGLSAVGRPRGIFTNWRYL